MYRQVVVRDDPSARKRHVVNTPRVGNAWQNVSLRLNCVNVIFKSAISSVCHARSLSQLSIPTRPFPLHCDGSSRIEAFVPLPIIFSFIREGQLPISTFDIFLIPSMKMGTKANNSFGTFLLIIIHYLRNHLFLPSLFSRIC